MEREPQSPQGGQHESDQQRQMREDFEAAQRRARESDDHAAARIAQLLQRGRETALSALATTGVVDQERIEQELSDLYERQPPDAQEWIVWLRQYCERREDKGPVDGWLPLHEQEAQAEQGERQQPVQPRIYVASLSDYVAGRLHGGWIDADQEPEELGVEIARMLARSPTAGAEEWAIHGYEGFFGLRLDEYEGLASVSRVAQGIVEHGEAFALLAAHASLDDLDFLDAAMSDSYLGAWDSMEAFAEHVTDDLGVEAYIAVAPESYRQYLKVDTALLARDLEMELTVLEGSDGRVHVFDPRR
jgi:antirestriction protein